MSAGIAAEEAVVAVTFFRDARAAVKHEEPYTLPALAARIRAVTASHKTRLPWLKLATFGDVRSDKGSLRHDTNVIAVTGIEADYDLGQMPFEAAHDLLEKQGVASILYTSPSHTEDAPRWRVLCPLSAEMPPASRRHMLGRLNGLFRGCFSRESWTLSQAYYFGSVNHNPSHQVALIEGLPIDRHDDLDEIWIGPGNVEQSPEQQATAGDERAIAELVRRIMTEEELHTALCPLAARLIGRNVPSGTVTEILRGVMLAWPEHSRDERWRARFNEIDRLVNSAARKFGPAAACRRELAAMAIQLFRRRRPSAEVCDAVRSRAAATGITPQCADAILVWACETELSRRRGNHA